MIADFLILEMLAISVEALAHALMHNRGTGFTTYFTSFSFFKCHLMLAHITVLILEEQLIVAGKKILYLI